MSGLLQPKITKRTPYSLADFSLVDFIVLLKSKCTLIWDRASHIKCHCENENVLQPNFIDVKPEVTPLMVLYLTESCGEKDYR